MSMSFCVIGTCPVSSSAIIFQQELSNQRRHTQQIVSHTNLNHAFSSVTPYTVATPDSFAFFDGLWIVYACLCNNLSSAQQQLKSRNKMHEIAVRQRLITDQDPRSEGLVQLSAEERRTLVQEGYPIPTRLPLSKSEEESLKIVRRKIKNKLSAQESRRKRKEYMDNLESRCQAYFNENSQLKSGFSSCHLYSMVSSTCPDFLFFARRFFSKVTVFC
uniref:BZIP domain-containing protein n=1 Tax=Angiostrongylus cantonensis TaxID=6313 RepID=A0A0K0CWZ0_ANGCA